MGTLSFISVDSGNALSLVERGPCFLELAHLSQCGSEARIKLSETGILAR